MKHTKGDWAYRACEDGAKRKGAYAILAGKKTIAHVLSDEDSPLAPMDVEAVANTRLMAASPDLLTACEDILGALVAAYANVSDPDDRRGWSDDDAFRTYRKAKDAIAKATK